MKKKQSDPSHVNWVKRIINRFIPAGKTETRKRLEEISRKLDCIQNSLDSQRKVIDFILESNNRTTNNTTILTQKDRDWFINFIQSELEAYRDWEEKLSRYANDYHGQSLENQRKWQEEAITSLQTWMSEMTKGENHRIVCEEETIKNMLESLWKRENTTQELSSTLADSLEQKAYKDYAERAINSSLREIKEYTTKTTKPLICFCGDYAIFPNAGPRNYMGLLASVHPEYEFCCFSEATWLSRKETEEKLSIPYFIVPNAIGARYRDETLSIELTGEDRGFIRQNVTLYEASVKAKKMNPYISESFAEYIVLMAYRYYTAAFSLLKPKKVFIFNYFFYLHQIIDYAAKEQKITVMYWEFGQLPGTLIFDEEGLIGESYPAREYDSFLQLPVSNEDIELAESVCDYMRNHNKLRHAITGDSETNSIIEELKGIKRPIILYAGGFPENSGVFPTSDHSKEAFLPSFLSDDDAVEFLSLLAETNNWEVIYKQHPLDKHRVDNSSKHVHVLRDGNIMTLIDHSDLLITVASSVAYSALFKEKPVLIIGYFELRGKKCTYESYDKETLEQTIKVALDKGMTEDMKKMFKRHIAQMTKYYLYDDSTPKEIQYGRQAEELKL